MEFILCTVLLFILVYSVYNTIYCMRLMRKVGGKDWEVYLIIGFINLAIALGLASVTFLYIFRVL